jgi:hypothetical protein
MGAGGSPTQASTAPDAGLIDCACGDSSTSVCNEWSLWRLVPGSSSLPCFPIPAVDAGPQPNEAIIDSGGQAYVYVGGPNRELLSTNMRWPCLAGQVIEYGCGWPTYSTAVSQTYGVVLTCQCGTVLTAPCDESTLWNLIGAKSGNAFCGSNENPTLGGTLTFDSQGQMVQDSGFDAKDTSDVELQKF